MAPWLPDSELSTVTAEKAKSFISKSLLDVRKSADEGLQKLRTRAKSVTDLANSFDRELENFRQSSLSLGFGNSCSGSLFTSLKNSGVLYTALNKSHVEDLDFLAKPLSRFQRSQSNPNLANQQNQLVERQTGLENKPDLSLLKRALIPLVKEEDFFLKSLEGMNKQNALRSGELVVREWHGTKVSHQSSNDLQPYPEGWEPWRRMKESWRDLEITAASSKSPAEFFDNLKKTQLFENVKKNLKFSVTNHEEEENVAPLDVPELLAYLVRESEPLLDQFGVRKDVAEKVCDIFQKYKRKEHLCSCASSLDHEDSHSASHLDTVADELDLRISSVVQSTGYHYKGGLWGEQPSKVEGRALRNVAIVTTASLPWMTGTAVNPLFRAAYLAKSGKQTVTLLVPWLCKNEQGFVYPNNMSFDSPEEQEVYIRDWLEARVGFKPNFKLVFYPGKFSQEKRSIMAAGDISQFIPDKEADIAVLEEPEHLNWYYHGKRWNDKFCHVVGVVHTNYLEYVKREKNGIFHAFLLEHINNWVTRVYCDKVLRLSAATQELPKSIICNVHGVSPKFLNIGQQIATEQSGVANFSKGAYFLGKMVWGKGYRELIDLLSEHKQDLQNLSVDVYGTGEDATAVKAEAEKLGLTLNFHQGRDHADRSLHGYKVFINPSISDVVCTTTAEALAMGKIVVCADHPSNEFFRPFPNCFMYKNSQEFVEKVKHALASSPEPLSSEQLYMLSWEAATERFIKYAELDQPCKKSMNLSSLEGIVEKNVMNLSMSLPDLTNIVDNGLALAHFCVSGNEAVRLVSGALPGTMNYNLQHSKDLHLPPPAVESPSSYTW